MLKDLLGKLLTKTEDSASTTGASISDVEGVLVKNINIQGEHHTGLVINGAKGSIFTDISIVQSNPERDLAEFIEQLKLENTRNSNEIAKILSQAANSTDNLEKTNSYQNLVDYFKKHADIASTLSSTALTVLKAYLLYKGIQS